MKVLFFVGRDYEIGWTDGCTARSFLQRLLIALSARPRPSASVLSTYPLRTSEKKEMKKAET